MVKFSLAPSHFPPKIPIFVKKSNHELRRFKTPFVSPKDTLPDEMLLQLQTLLNSWQQQKTNVIDITPVRKAGSAKGAYLMKADFDAPLDDFKDYMP
jgi:hypothetical protein